MKNLEFWLTPTWSDLRAYGENRVLRTSYVWFFLVPIFAKLLLHIETLNFYLMGQAIKIEVGLPFAWQMFFFASVFLSVASFLYATTCPKFIKDHRDFNDFKNQGKGASQISMALAVLVARDTNGAETQERTFRHKFVDSEDPSNKEIPESFPIFEFKLKQGVEMEAFWDLHDYADRVSYRVRQSLALLYICGFLLIGVVLLQNISYVSKLVF